MLMNLRAESSVHRTAQAPRPRLHRPGRGFAFSPAPAAFGEPPEPSLLSLLVPLCTSLVNLCLLPDLTSIPEMTRAKDARTIF